VKQPLNAVFNITNEKPMLNEQKSNNETVIATLSNLLPQLKKYQNSIFVIKYGGNAMVDPSLQKSFAEDIVLLQALGIRVVVVHGGGPQIEIALARLNLKGNFIHGLRVTDDQTMQVVQWVLAGQVQQEIVGLIQSSGGRAVGLCGFDGGLIHAKKTQLSPATALVEAPDLGWVGEVESVNSAIIHSLLTAGFIPVISPVAMGDNGHSYNVNADVVASAIASELSAEKLFLLTNITGVLDKTGALIRELNQNTVAALIKDGTISGGMLPKIGGALDAAKAGVANVHITDGRVAHALLLEILADVPCGTIVSTTR
jgi:acetylglutamate kinase